MMVRAESLNGRAVSPPRSVALFEDALGLAVMLSDEYLVKRGLDARQKVTILRTCLMVFGSISVVFYWFVYLSLDRSPGGLSAGLLALIIVVSAQSVAFVVCLRALSRLTARMIVAQLALHLRECGPRVAARLSLIKGS